MLLFQKLVDETQMPKPQKYTDIFILTKKLFIVGLQGLQNISTPVERPCSLQLEEYPDPRLLFKLAVRLLDERSF